MLDLTNLPPDSDEEDDLNANRDDNAPDFYQSKTVGSKVQVISTNIEQNKSSRSKALSLFAEAD